VILLSDDVFLPFLCHELMLTVKPDMQCIVCMSDGKLVAGVVYENYNTVSISAHIWIEERRQPSKEWMAAIFDYPFNRLGIHKIIGRVYSGNDEAVRLDTKFGFIHEATIKDFCPDGDLFIYTMTREQCRILNNPLWSRVVDRVAAC